MKNVSALYENFDSARNAVTDLVNAGFNRDNISLIVNDRDGIYRDRIGDVSEDVSGSEGAGFGAVVGALVGLGAMLIPGVGPVIAAGPLVAGLVGAGVGAAAGAVTGGITASLIDSGMDEESAHFYAEGVRRGNSLVSIQVEDAHAHEAANILNSYHPIDAKTRTEEWRAGGWTGFHPDAPDYYDMEEDRRLNR